MAQPGQSVTNTNTTVGSAVSELTSPATTPPPPTDVPKIIALTVTLAGIVVVALVGYLIWRHFCKSIRPRYGVEKQEQSEDKEDHKKKANYYDQFNVEDHQLTVNSVTAILWDEEEHKNRNNMKLQSEKRDEDSTPQHREIKTGKRTFSIDKVPDNLKTAPAKNGPMIIKVPKNVAKSLTCGDSSQYTLAIIDKNSKTIHNIDMREYKLMRGGVPVKTGSTGRLHHSHHNSHHRAHKTAKPRRQRSSDGYAHDEPDSGMEQSGRFTISTPVDAEFGCSTDGSETTKSSKFETDELSSTERIPLCRENGVKLGGEIATEVHDSELTATLLT